MQLAADNINITGFSTAAFIHLCFDRLVVETLVGT